MNAMPILSAVPPVRSGLRRAKTVLVVDSFAPICDLVAWHLSAIGYRVLTANCPEEALRIVGSTAGMEIDLLLTDAEGPSVAGQLLAKWFSFAHPSAPVLFMCSSACSPSADAGFLHKPFTLAKLSAAVKNSLGEYIGFGGHENAVATNALGPAVKEKISERYRSRIVSAAHAE